jgi:hypothetical protein
MNTRKIKLALTVGLMNNDPGNNALNLVRELMLGFQEVGSFLGLSMKRKSNLNPGHIKQTYALQFENCTLDVELVQDSRTNSQYVQNFQLR